MKKIKYYDSTNSKLILKYEKAIVKLKEKKLKNQQKLEAILAIEKKISNRKQRKAVHLSATESKIDVKIHHHQRSLRLLKEGKLVKPNPIERFKQWFSNIEYRKQTMIWGVIFIVPWIIGMALFFLPSFYETITWSFNEVTLTKGVISKEFVGFKNFTYLFTEHVIDSSNVFSVSLLTFIQGLLIDLPVIIIFSILIAVLLNKPFKGHRLIKAIFFIPVIYNLSVITETLSGNFGRHISDTMNEDVLFVTQITGFFLELGIGDKLIDIVLNTINRIFTIVNLSGIQILIFIAAIQSIPTHLYEAAEIEGSTKYEVFWKITIPMITPIILTAAIFTIVDSFARAPIFRFLDYAIADGNYGLGAAISVSYFLINILIVGVIFLLFRGRVFYYDEE